MTSTSVSSLLLSDFNQFLSRQMGLHFEKEKQEQLLKSVEAAAAEFGCKTPGKCIQWLMSSNLSREQIEILAGHLTVGETYFFREKNSYDILESRILPEVIHSRRKTGEKRLRIWSAACSSGEEAYSIAMVMDRKKEELSDFNTLILATDINRKALKKARQGIYSEWSFRGMPQWTKNHYFTREENKQYKIRPHLKEMVVFDYLNLVEDACPSLLHNTNGMDIVFCRNVLMYFSPKSAQKVMDNLSRCLVTGGWLILSPTDAFNVSTPILERINITDAPIYRKVPEGTTAIAVTEPRIPVIKPFKPPEKPAYRRTPQYTSPPTLKPIQKPPPAAEKTREPNDSYEKAFEYYKQGFYAKAIEISESLLSTPTPAKKIYELLTRSHANQGKLEEAEKWCQKIIEVAKLDPQYRYLLATIQLERGKTEDAVVSLKQGLYINRDYIPAHFMLGHIALQRRNNTEANRHFDNTLSLLADLEDNAPVLEIEDGLTVGRMREIITAIKEKEPFND